MSFAIVAISTSPAWAGPPAMPIRRVRLYETGVGYFERRGVIRPDLGLPVPSSHLDDALKTMVILSDDGKTKVAGVEFGSRVSEEMAKALAGLPEEEATPLAFSKLLGSLRGSGVVVRTKTGSVNGRLVDVLSGKDSDLVECSPHAPARPRESTKHEVTHATLDSAASCIPMHTDTLVVLSDKGELQRLKTADVLGVRPLARGLEKRIGSALDALSHTNAQAEKRLRVLATGTSPITLGYVAETPVWRSTYRVVLGTDDRAKLQGWALLHNDTDEDWKSVGVELVNGQPDSFLFPLAAPRYARRELVTPDNELSTVPQLLKTTPDAMWAGDEFGVGGLGISGSGAGGGGAAHGVGLGHIGTIGHGAAAGTTESSLLSVGSLSAIDEAEGVEAGALFRYSLPNAVDLRAHGSALVPFMAKSVKARRLAWFASPGESARSGIHVTNETKQTLPPGTIAIFADGGFAGETSIDRLKPGEKQLLKFGSDLDIELTERRHVKTDHPRLVEVSGDRLIEHFVRSHDIDYVIENRSGSDRTAYLKLNFVNNTKIKGADEVLFDHHDGVAHLVFSAPAKKEGVRHVHADEGLTNATAIEKLDWATVDRLARTTALPKGQRVVLTKAARHLRAAKQIAKKLAKLEDRRVQLKEDADRLRGHARAVGRSGIRGSDEIVRRLLATEDEIMASRNVRERLVRIQRQERAQALALARSLGR